MVHTEPRTRVPREGFAWFRHATQGWVMNLPVDDVADPPDVIVVQGQRMERVEPGENPYPGNPWMRVRSCHLCPAVWWEHAHSASTTLGHLNDEHPGWRDET